MLRRLNGKLAHNNVRKRKFVKILTSNDGDGDGDDAKICTESNGSDATRGLLKLVNEPGETHACCYIMS